MRKGFTLTELIVVVMIISMFVFMAQINLFGLFTRNTFRAQTRELISTLQMAASAAAESDRRYEVFIDLVEQSYFLRQITTPDISQVLEEEIIVENELADNCRFAYVEFDDGKWVNDGTASFRAGHAGWAYGGKIVLLDDEEQPYSIVINRINRIIKMVKGDVDLILPREEDDLLFK